MFKETAFRYYHRNIQYRGFVLYFPLYLPSVFPRCSKQRKAFICVMLGTWFLIAAHLCMTQICCDVSPLRKPTEHQGFTFTTTQDHRGTVNKTERFHYSGQCRMPCSWVTTTFPRNYQQRVRSVTSNRWHPWTRQNIEATLHTVCYFIARVSLKEQNAPSMFGESGVSDTDTPSVFTPVKPNSTA